MLLGFAGPAGSGKDTCGAYFIEHHSFKKLSFAGPLKAALAAMGLPEPANQELKEDIIPWLGVSWRHCAQTLGTEWGRKLINGDIWVKMALRSMLKSDNYVVTDVRFENEAAAIRAAGGRIVHLEGRKAPMAEGTQGHISETGIFKEDKDFRLDNSVSLYQLHVALNGMYRFLGKAQ